MSLDKLVDSTQLDSGLTSVADAIRAKSGGSSQLAFPAGFVSEIQAIPSGGGGSNNSFEVVDVVVDNKKANATLPIPISDASKDNYLMIYSVVESGVYSNGVLTMDQSPTVPASLNIPIFGTCLRVSNNGKVTFTGTAVGTSLSNKFMHRMSSVARASVSSYGNANIDENGETLDTQNSTITIGAQYGFGAVGYYFKYRVYIHGWNNGQSSGNTTIYTV